MSWRIAVIQMCLSALPLGILGASADVPILSGTGVIEQIDPVVPITGGGIVGAVIAGPQDAVTTDGLFVRINTPPASGEITVFLGSPDNRYSASWNVRLPADLRGWARLIYPGNHPERLESYAVSELGAFATDGLRVYPLRWGEASDESVLLVMINSERSDAFSVEREQGQARRVNCEQIRSMQTLRFDKVCRMNLGTTARTDQTIEIRRRQAGAVLSSIKLRLDE